MRSSTVRDGPQRPNSRDRRWLRKAELMRVEHRERPLVTGGRRCHRCSADRSAQRRCRIGIRQALCYRNQGTLD